MLSKNKLYPDYEKSWPGELTAEGYEFVGSLEQYGYDVYAMVHLSKLGHGRTCLAICFVFEDSDGIDRDQHFLYDFSSLMLAGGCERKRNALVETIMFMEKIPSWRKMLRWAAQDFYGEEMMEIE